jgi:hypothetical protein
MFIKNTPPSTKHESGGMAEKCAKIPRYFMPGFGTMAHGAGISDLNQPKMGIGRFK